MGSQCSHCFNSCLDAPCLWIEDGYMKRFEIKCFSFLNRSAKLVRQTTSEGSSDDSTSSPLGRVCGGCDRFVEEFAQGKRGELLCRACLRIEDEKLLSPITHEEKRGLAFLSSVLDAVSWKYWKPGDQPAKLLDWLYLGDLEEAMDFELLANRGISAVLNLINWWELSARLPDVSDLSSIYAYQNVEFMEADSEDRLFFNIVQRCWPKAQTFLDQCKNEGRRVLVNCKAGHNRSACVCVCWLVVHEQMPLLQAVELVQERRGTILSNHGFRLQLVRLALSLQRLGEPSVVTPAVKLETLCEASSGHGDHVDGFPERPLGRIIMKKRLSTNYDITSKEFRSGSKSAPSGLISTSAVSQSFIANEVNEHLSQRTLNMELLACLYHRQKKFIIEYEYTTTPPTVIGSGFSGDVVLCKRREKTAVSQNKETSVRCVKRFDLQKMSQETLDKLKNEAVIYLSLEHPHIARLFDVFEDAEEVSLVMQYCSGGTLEDDLKKRGAYGERQFQDVAVGMLLAVNYIHRAGIVHRDIKPRNWVYEADGATVKLIDFGFSVKSYLSSAEDGGSLTACLGTLGYIAPEVIRARSSTDAAYTEKCDIWSLGIVFLELLTGRPAFHRDRGMCDGYTEDIVLREIEDVSEESIELLLNEAPVDARPFLRRFLTKDVAARPSAYEALMDPYLSAARGILRHPRKALPVSTVLDRFKAHGQASKPTRAWVLAVARSPTYLPWKDFCALRDTFKMFDVHGLSGTVSLDTFVSVVMACSWDAEISVAEVRAIWHSVCGEQESLSYCEFLASILPPIEDVFEDVCPELDDTDADSAMDMTPRSPTRVLDYTPRKWDYAPRRWDPSLPISSYLRLLRLRKHRPETVEVVDEHMPVKDVVKAMSDAHHRWVVVQYRSGRRAFFDYMDINHHLVKLNSSRKSSADSIAETSANFDRQASDVLARVISMPVGLLANCSEHCAFVPRPSWASLSDVLKLISGAPDVRRVPIVGDNGEIMHVFSCFDFLKLALRFNGPTAVLKSRAARTFDRRTTIFNVSVLVNDHVLNAMRIMDSEHLTICPATSRELSGDLGGAVAINVVSVTDLKWVISTGQLDILDRSVEDFIAWRSSLVSADVEGVLRQQRLRRFNVVSVHAAESLYTLAQRLLASKLQRIFLSSEEIARIVGIVSSRDILVEVIDQLL